MLHPAGAVPPMRHVAHPGSPRGPAARPTGPRHAPSTAAHGRPAAGSTRARLTTDPRASHRGRAIANDRPTQARTLSMRCDPDSRQAPGDPFAWLYWETPSRSSARPSAGTPHPHGVGRSATELGGARLSESRPLQRARQRRPLRGLGRAAGLLGRDPRRLPLAALAAQAKRDAHIRRLGWSAGWFRRFAGATRSP